MPVSNNKNEFLVVGGFYFSLLVSQDTEQNLGKVLK